MVATLFKLNNHLTLIASLPTFFLGVIEEPLGLIISGTFRRVVPPSATLCADFCFATTAAAHLSVTVLAADVLWLNPFTAFPINTVEAIAGGELGEFAIPGLLEAVIKKAIHVLEGNVLLGTAPRGHVLRVGDGHFKDAFETRVAHAMATLEICTFGGRGFFHANNAVNRS